MKTSSTWNFRSVVGRIMMGLVLAAMIGSIDVAPALAKNKDDHKRMGKHDNGRYKHRGRGYDRDRYVHGYRGRGYAPPPVVYAPPPPPGIGIFFPPVFIHP
jgi:hypothetical protein